jgi:triacylglycerol esterase/lipase EstA (alpha/beta hydrolase family)
VVLVHGTGANMSDNWSYVSPALAAAGYCVFALNYGGPPRFAGYSYGLGPLRQSAQQLSGFVDKVLAATGATQVDMVGHSQGGMMPRWYIRFLGGAAKVHELIGLAPSNHGSTLDGLASLQRGHNSGFDKFEAKYCAACIDQTAGSQFLTELNAGHEVEPGVAYTVIETKYDEVVTPYRSAFLNGGRNITLQNACAFDVADHLGVAFDPVVLRLIENELDPAHAVKASCKSFVPSR